MTESRIPRRVYGKTHSSNTRAEPIKSKGLHPRNQHVNGYDFTALMKHTPALQHFVRPNPYGQLSIDFADPLAVKMLNLALLRLHYQIEDWDIPAGFLCPPIPGRVDYLHYIADLLAEDAASHSKTRATVKPLTGPKIKVLDVGTGANGIYPILGVQSYGWHFVASDIDPRSVSNVQQIVDKNGCLRTKIALRLQANESHIFNGIIAVGERFDLTMCNPPFHASLVEASAGSERKLKNLASNRQTKGHSTERIRSSDKLNFGGQKAELWCEGGERRFLLTMITESKTFMGQCLWFTSLVSKKENLKPCYQALERAGAVAVKTIEMKQGNKLTRVLAWSFLESSQRNLWHRYRSQA